MYEIIKRIFLGLAVATLAACAMPQQKYDYTAYQQCNPRSIVVLPPLNNTPELRATYGVLSTVTQPLAESGYYVFPVALVDQTFKENGLMDPGEMHQAPLNKIREIFGADAALYITVTQYGSSYQVVSSDVVVRAEAKLIDTNNGQVLWEGWARASDAEGRNNNNGGLAALLVTAIVKQVAHSVTDEKASLRIAKIASTRLLLAKPNGLLYGPRSPLYGK